MIVGIDPGLSGALFFIDPHNPVTGESVDLPIHLLARGGKNKREVDIAGLIGILALRQLTHAFVEQVGAMPGQGTSSIFSFGKTYGIILGVQHSVDPGRTSPLETSPHRAEGQGCGPGQGLAATAASR